jgi:hypothetical protein
MTRVKLKYKVIKAISTLDSDLFEIRSLKKRLKVVFPHLHDLGLICTDQPGIRLF